MKKEIIKIELDGKLISSISLLLDDNLVSIRESLKNNLKNSYIFLDEDNNSITKEDEIDFLLKDIVNEKTIKLKSYISDIKVLLNNVNISSINSLEFQNLQTLRKFLENNVKINFDFLDINGNPIKMKEEKNISLLEITKDKIINLKSEEYIPPNNNQIDFSKYEILEMKNNFTIYNYSYLEKKTHYNIINEYSCDKFDKEDYENSCVALFFGKTGEGKTTAINAIFNVIKGIKLEDNYRFILINEKLKKLGAVTQTEGINIYYLKDFCNKPIIIIDSQGYGNTSGIEFDDKLDKAFRFFFSRLIDHINICFFTLKADTSEFDIFTRNIYTRVSCFFPANFMDNFIILGTFADKYILKEKPNIYKIIENERLFDWSKKEAITCYTFDSKSLFYNDIDKLIRYSYEQIKKLYETKFKELKPIFFKNICSDFLKERNNTRNEYNKLKYFFDNLIIEFWNLLEKNKKLNEKIEKIKEMEKKIISYEMDINMFDSKDLIQKLNKEITAQLINEIETKYIKVLQYDDKHKYIYCSICERNCDVDFDCLDETIFYFKNSDICEICGCNQNNHKYENYHLVFKKETNIINSINFTINNDNLANLESTKNNSENKTGELNNLKNKLLCEKNKILDDIKNIQINMENMKEQIIKKLVRLKRLNDNLSHYCICGGDFLKNIEYFHCLISSMEEIGLKEEDQKMLIKKMQDHLEI